MENLVVKDFEVAGIQLNGAKNVTIRDCHVGPSATTPLLATFSSARLIGEEEEESLDSTAIIALASSPSMSHNTRERGSLLLP